MASMPSEFAHDLQQLQDRVSQLDDEVKALRVEVAAFTVLDAKQSTSLGPIEDDEMIKAAVRLAEGFGFRILSTERESDPDCAASNYYVLHVEGDGTSAELIARQLQWHARLDEISIACRGRIRLDMVVSS